MIFGYVIYVYIFHILYTFNDIEDTYFFKLFLYCMYLYYFNDFMFGFVSGVCFLHAKPECFYTCSNHVSQI